MMKRNVFKERRTFEKYDNAHIIGYLNEEVLENYFPEGEEQAPWPVAYAYTGSEADGGTVMECSNQSDYGELANAIIRSKFSVSEEMAIQRHAINGDYEEAPEEYDTYNDWCKYAVKTAKEWLARQ